MSELKHTVRHCPPISFSRNHMTKHPHRRRFGVVVTLLTLATLWLAACGKGDSTQGGLLSSFTEDKTVSRYFPNNTEGPSLPPALNTDNANFLLGKLKPELFSTEGFSTGYLARYNAPLKPEEQLAATPGYQDKLKAHATKLPSRFSYQMDVQLKPYDVARGGFPLSGPMQTPMNRLMHIDLTSISSNGVEGSSFSSTHLRFNHPVDVSFVKTEKPAFCKVQNCEAADYQQSVKLAIVFDVKGVRPNGSSLDIEPVEQVLIAPEYNVQTRERKWIVFGKSAMVDAPMDWASQLGVDHDGSGAYLVQNGEFLYRLAAANIPALLEQATFIEQFGDRFDCENYKASGNEFDWPKAQTILLAEIKRRVAEVAAIKKLYGEYKVSLGEYDTATQSFELNSQGFMNTGYFELENSSSGGNCRGARRPSGSLPAIRLEIEKIMNLPRVHVPTEAARQFVADSGSNRNACVRLFWDITGTKVKKEYSTDTVVFAARSNRYEVLDGDCKRSLGSTAFDASGEAAK